MADRWLLDSTRRANAARIDTTVADPARVGDYLSGGRDNFEAVPAGSYVALYHQASDLDPAMPAAIRRWNAMSSRHITLRSRAQVAALLTGLAPVSPGLVPVTEWRPAPDDPRFEEPVPLHGAVARKP